MNTRGIEANGEVGDFRIERRIGAGGMGVVYQARQLSLDRPVALKVLGSALNQPADIARFRRAARAAARLNHPGIARVYFVGQDDQLCYMAMELIDGTPVQKLISRLAAAEGEGVNIDLLAKQSLADEPAAKAMRFDEKAETVADCPTQDVAGEGQYEVTPAGRRLAGSVQHVRRCCALVRDAALTLHYAHGQGVIHRDIKPGNLMLDRAGGVHLVDFGLARFFEDATVTQTGQLVGTPMYMSPEQVIGRSEPDIRTDIYSLGLVLYELLTFRPPLLAPSREELLRRIVTKALPPVGGANAAVPRELESVVHKATAKDPDERYPTAAEFAADIERFLNGDPVLAPPYRYRLDESEIAATRPGWILSIAACCIGLAILMATIGTVILGVLAIDWFTRTAIGDRLPAAVLVWGVCLVVLGAGLILLSYGTLSGRGWARRLGVVVALVVAAAAVSGMAAFCSFAYPEGFGANPNLVVGLIVSFLLFVTAVLAAYKLLQRQTREWFAFAGRVRSEQRQGRTAPR
jgi:serine/threonine protein kinase